MSSREKEGIAPQSVGEAGHDFLPSIVGDAGHPKVDGLRHAALVPPSLALFGVLTVSVMWPEPEFRRRRPNVVVGVSSGHLILRTAAETA